MPRDLRVLDLGAAVPYREALGRQMRDIEHIAGHDHAPHLLKFLQHPSVFTHGRTFDLSHLRISKYELQKKGVELFEVSRGGSVTFHGPGQLVVYLHVDLRALGLSLTRYLRDLEQWVIDAMASLGIRGQRLPGLTGVWVDGRKICAMGVAAKKFVSYHGLSINIHADLAYYDWIVPCGLTQPVANLQDFSTQQLDDATITALLLQHLPPWLAELRLLPR